MNIYLNAGLEAAKEAGEFLMSKFGKVESVSSKDRNDILTEADLGAEEIILRRLKVQFPEHCFFSEEAGYEGYAHSDYLWIIDPLDGTVNYTAGLELFSVSIGLAHKGQAVMGIVYAPLQGEMYSAVAGEGAFLNNTRISVSQNDILSDSIINIGLSCHYNNEQFNLSLMICDRTAKLTRGVRIFESGALTACYIACGRMDGKISVKTDPFSNTSGTVIIQEAGGKVSDFEGRGWSMAMKNIVCSNRAVHREIMEAVIYECS
ncbi:MAG: inositol monophosphatase [candidate division Zixibacteria bacterium]|nr:inositol monophosphatase [Candidatus Tariuqbacter arcticus]